MICEEVHCPDLQNRRIVEVGGVRQFRLDVGRFGVWIDLTSEYLIWRVGYLVWLFSGGNKTGV